MSNWKDWFGQKILNREIILYGIFGVLTSVLNILVFRILSGICRNYKMANIITLIIVKLAAYLCNKNFVFQSKCANVWELAKEFLRFLAARGATALIDYFGLIVFVEVLAVNQVAGKAMITILVVIINYVVGRKHVFR